MKSLRTGMICCVLILQCVALWALCGVRISDLNIKPKPQNPVRVWGRVTSVSPVKIGDGTTEITVSGLTATLGDYVAITGNWSGGVLAASGPADVYTGAAQVTMIYIPAGSFNMGTPVSYTESHSSNEHPQHSVNLSGYYIGKFEVTRGEYRAFMDAGGYTNSSYWSTDGWNWKVSSKRTEPAYWYANQDWGAASGSSQPFIQTENHPVVGVTYYEAEAFCHWAGGHLPTEAQWERVARWTGSHANVYPWGDVWNDEKCNNVFDTLYPGYQTAPVGSYSSCPSPTGCQDMAGNVWEWCKDWFLDRYYSQTPIGGWSDPQGPTSGSLHVLRGGCWGGGVSNYRCAYRYSDFDPNYSLAKFGFRLVR